MDKPDFGIGTGPDRRYLIQWEGHPERVAYVRHLAATGASAAEIAVEIGLESWQGPRISAICRRFGIALKGNAGRPSKGVRFARIEVSRAHGLILRQLGERLDCSPRIVLTRLVDAVLDQGETFAVNMLDDK